MATKTNNWVACHECDALQRLPELAPGAAADCMRCGAVLCRSKPESLRRTLAFMSAAALAFACALAWPVMELDARGIQSESTIYGLVQALFQSGWPTVALLVLFTVIVIPVVQLGAALYLLVSLELGRVPALLTPAVRTIDAVWRWGMVEVFLLGAIVSLVKLTKVADVDLGWALYAIGAYLALATAGVASYDPGALWRRVEELRAKARERAELPA
jgi:paraquat-inducible protein A